MSGIGIAIEVLVAVLVVLGTLITLISSLGVLRLPDVYTRAHATTKSATLGLLCILAGTFLHFLHTHQLVSIRLLLVIFFVFLTAPVAGHMIIRAAHRAGVPLADISARDALREDFGPPADARDSAAGASGAAVDLVSGAAGGTADRISDGTAADSAEANACGGADGTTDPNLECRTEEDAGENETSENKGNE